MKISVQNSFTDTRTTTVCETSCLEAQKRLQYYGQSSRQTHMTGVPKIMSRHIEGSLFDQTWLVPVKYTGLKSCSSSQFLTSWLRNIVDNDNPGPHLSGEFGLQHPRRVSRHLQHTCNRGHGPLHLTSVDSFFVGNFTRSIQFMMMKAAAAGKVAMIKW